MILLLLFLAEQDTTNQQSIELKIYQDQKMTRKKPVHLYDLKQNHVLPESNIKGHTQNSFPVHTCTVGTYFV